MRTSEAQEQTTRAAKRLPNVCPQGGMSHIPLRVGERVCLVVVGNGTDMTWLKRKLVTPTSL